MTKKTYEYFKNKDGTLCAEAISHYNHIIKYAKRYHLKNTLTAVKLAVYLHNGQYRDGGQPYIIHPLEATNYLILLNVKNPIHSMNINRFHDNKTAWEKTKQDLDSLLSTTILHDVAEECQKKLPKKGAELETKYKLHPDIFRFVNILTKHKEKPDYTLDGYFREIGMYWQTSIAKIADRVSNCSTIDAFDKKRMEKYVREIVKYFYPMIYNSKIQYPAFSKVLTIMNFLIVSISESVASVLNLDGVINDVDYQKTFSYLEKLADTKAMPNTRKALSLSKIYYKNLKRKSGDDFIIHPLRVCSFLIELKITDDKICAA